MNVDVWLKKLKACDIGGRPISIVFVVMAAKVGPSNEDILNLLVLVEVI